MTWAEQRIPSGIAALLIASVPLWMSILGRVLLAERVSWTAALGLAVGFAGLVLLVRPSGPHRLDLVATLAVRTSVVGTYAYVNPVVAVALGAALGGEQVTGRTLIAGTVILAGVALIVTGQPGRDDSEPARDDEPMAAT